jgi:murein DD-endopeptidase MepM/ murein hydrolase activator NlpD
MVIIRDDENFAEKATLRFTLAKIVLIFSVIFLIVLGISFIMATTLLSRWFDPRSEHLQTNRTLLELESRVDSLSVEVKVKDQYLVNFKNILEGNITFADYKDTPQQDSIKSATISQQQLSPIDSLIRKQFEESDYEQLSFINSTRNDLQQLYFFSPISNGVISKKFLVKERHFAVDIVAKKNEPIKSVADGTVIMSSWTQDSGYVIGVQHKNQLISFYKHNSVNLKSVGDLVKAGDILAIIGNSGEYTDGPHLHFELWYNGNPVNPEDFIPF